MALNLSALLNTVKERVTILPELGRQTLRSATAQSQARRVGSLFTKRTSTPISTPSFLLPKSLKVPQLVTGEEDVLQKSGALQKEIQERIGKPLADFVVGTPEQLALNKKKFAEPYTYADLGKDLSNLGLNFTVNPLARLGLTGQEVITGKKVGAGAGFGFEGGKAFEKEVIGSYPAIYQEQVKAGDTPAVAAFRTGILAGFDSLVATGLCREALRPTRAAVRQLPESLLTKLRVEEMPLDDVVGYLFGTKEKEVISTKVKDFINALSNDERRALFSLTNAYEKAGATKLPIVKRVPTKLGEFAGRR